MAYLPVVPGAEALPPGTYWSSTVSGPVIYGITRLELARLLFADFDTRVLHIVAQPFLLRAAVDQMARKHVPDYLREQTRGPVWQAWRFGDWTRFVQVSSTRCFEMNQSLSEGDASLR